MGAQGERLTIEEKKQLISLCAGLESYLAPLGSELPPQEDFLIRIACYYAEAPVGQRLTNETEELLSSEDIRQNSSVDTGFMNVGNQSNSFREVGDYSPDPEECDEALNLYNQGLLQDFTVFASCQQNGQDGIRYLTCKLRKHTLYHDSRFHCYRSGRYQTGPCAYKCRGRCGRGCGSSNRLGAYTRDCAEHDRCAGHDGGRSWGVWGNDRSCGDEWDEARDDFINARNSCRGTGGC